MYVKPLFILAALLASHAWAAAPQSERAAREECSAYAEAGMHDCLEAKARASEVALMRTESRLRRQLARWHEDARYRRLALARLNAASKAFVRYREQQCAFHASLGGGAIGNALDIRRLACIQEQNARRSTQLGAMLDDLRAR